MGTNPLITAGTVTGKLDTHPPMAAAKIGIEAPIITKPSPIVTGNDTIITFN
jgi:hypothetical protein